MQRKFEFEGRHSTTNVRGRRSEKGHRRSVVVEIEVGAGWRSQAKNGNEVDFGRRRGSMNVYIFESDPPIGVSALLFRVNRSRAGASCEVSCVRPSLFPTALAERAHAVAPRVFREGARASRLQHELVPSRRQPEIFEMP